MPLLFIIIILFSSTVYAQEPSSANAPTTDATEATPEGNNVPADMDQNEDFQVDEPEDESTAPAAPSPATNNAKTQNGIPATTQPLPANNNAVFNENTPPEQNYTDTTILQGLNKITARTSNLTIPVGSSTHFGNLEIFTHLCWKSPPDAAPDSKALLEIWEQKPGEDKKQLFYGWMFASTPGLSALEHPVYDITVIECKRSTAHK